MTMKIKLSDHFTYGKLIRFSIPSVMMLLFTSIYGIVDGLFVSNFVGKTPFVAVNLIFPVIMIVCAFGFMMGAGGTAVVAKTLGEGDREAANKYFSFIFYSTIALGVVVSALCVTFIRPLAIIMGAEGELLEYAVRYGTIVVSALPFAMLQNLFQSFFVAAEKPKLGLFVTVGSGVTNMILDALLVAIIPLGLEGAAVATAASQVVGGVAPLIYFARKNNSLLKLTKTKFYGKVLSKTVTNGSSEFLSNISGSVVTMLYNTQLLKYAGENGVAAYGAMMYLGFIFIAIFIGYAVGSAPVIGFHYGADNKDELKGLLRKSSVITFTTGIIMTLISVFLSKPLAMIFVSYDRELLKMTVEGFRIFATSFVLSGFCIFTSSFFTALNNGMVSAVSSFLRTLVYQIAGVFILPLLFDINGIWLSIPVAEALSLITNFILLNINKRKYGYM